MVRIITVFSHNSNGSGFATAGYLSYWSRLGYEVR